MTRKICWWRICGILLLLSIAANSYSQIEQPKRFEIEVSYFERSFEVINLHKDGVVLYRQIDKRNREGRTWEIIFLDSELNEIWKNEYVFDFGYSFAGYAANNSHFYLLFYNNKTGRKELELFEFDFEGNTPARYTIKNLFPLELSHFEVTNEAAIVGGYYQYKPVAIYFSFRDKKSFVLPTIYNKNSEIIEVKTHEDNTISILVTEKTEDRRTTIALKHYAPDGTMITNTLLKPENGNYFIFGSVAGAESGALLVAGTYSTHRSDYSRGIFITRLAPDGSENSNYYNYADLKNFFNYMKAKRQRRLKERISRKRIKGRKLKFNYRLLVHDIIRKPDGFLMIGEAFYPKYSRSGNYNNRYFSDPYFNSRDVRTTGYNRMYFEGYKYTHAVVIEFDEKGRVKWDNSFEISDVLSNTLDQYVHAAFDGDNVVLLYLYENSIRSKIIQGDSVVEGKTYNDLKLTYESDEVKKTDFEFGGLDHWYDNNFIAYGVQKIKNPKEPGIELHRRVYFVNKVIYK